MDPQAAGDDGSHVFGNALVVLALTLHEHDEFVATPRYKGAGTLLMRTAIELSLELEYKGRIGLHSLRQADGFYTHCGMTDLGPDAAFYGLRYFEMTSEQAALYLK